MTIAGETKISGGPTFFDREGIFAQQIKLGGRIFLSSCLAGEAIISRCDSFQANWMSVGVQEE
jgi:hypothetical protein